MLALEPDSVANSMLKKFINDSASSFSVANPSNICTLYKHSIKTLIRADKSHREVKNFENFYQVDFAYIQLQYINFCLVAYRCNEIKKFHNANGNIFETFTTGFSKEINVRLFFLPAKYFPFGMLNSEFSFFTQQSYGQRIRCNHDQHRNVKCNQRTEYKKCSIINHAFILRWHNIQNVNYTCGKGF